MSDQDTLPRAPAYWTDSRLVRTASNLRDRAAVLRADIARELRKHDAERFGLLAANVADSAETAIADLIGDLYLAEIDRDVHELHDVERALQRITAGTYGSCIDCGQAVDPMRLEFNPHAALAYDFQISLGAERYIIAGSPLGEVRVHVSP